MNGSSCYLPSSSSSLSPHAWCTPPLSPRAFLKDFSLVEKYAKRAPKAPVFRAWLFTNGKGRRVNMAIKDFKGA